MASILHDWWMMAMQSLAENICVSHPQGQQNCSNLNCINNFTPWLLPIKIASCHFASDIMQHRELSHTILLVQYCTQLSVSCYMHVHATVFIIVQLHFFIPSFPMPGSSPKLSFMWTSSFASNTFLFFVLFRSMYCQYASMLMFNFSLKFGHALCMQFLVLPSSRSFATAKEKEHSADKNTVCSFFFFFFYLLKCSHASPQLRCLSHFSVISARWTVSEWRKLSPWHNGHWLLTYTFGQSSPCRVSSSWEWGGSMLSG